MSPITESANLGLSQCFTDGLGPGLAARVTLATLLIGSLAPHALAQNRESRRPSTANDAPAWGWHQILEHPRIGGRLTAVTVDKDNPDHIYVGTEESTLLRSFDGGVTWMEYEIRPFRDADIDLRTALQPPGLPDIRESPPMEYQIFMDPPFSSYGDRLAIPFDSLYFSIRPEFVRGGFFPVPPKYTVDILSTVTTTQRYQTKEVRRIAVCPNATYNLLIATNNEVFGSPDDGHNFVRVFTFPGEPVEVWHVICSGEDHRRMAIATDLGAYVSHDGGVTWDPQGDAASFMVTGIAFSEPAPKQPERLYVSDGGSLYIFGVDAAAGLEFRYPDYNDVSTAPWRDIRWVSSTARGDVYIATDDGVRVSRDWGYTWANTGHALLDRSTWFQVEVGPGDRPGVERVAALSRNCPLSIDDLGRGVHVLCDNDFVYASDDSGRTWFPFFYGLSNRRFRQMAAVPAHDDGPARWLVLTEGELWASAPPHHVETPSREDPDAFRWVLWAQRKLRETPSLIDVTDATLNRFELGGKGLQSFYDRSRFNNLLPRIDVQFEYMRASRARLEAQMGTDPFKAGEDRLRTDVAFWLQMRWEFQNLPVQGEMIPRISSDLYRLRQDMWTLAELAWHERILHLTQIARGQLDAVQIASLRTRIESLECVLKIWSGLDFGNGVHAGS